jgi:acyl-CoA thioester hydrolase
MDGEMSSNHRHEFHETRLRVRYAETDQMGVVEREDGLFIAVAEVKCRYRAPVYYDEEVVVRTRLKTVRESVVVFSYELVRLGSKVLLAEGETTHIVTDSKMKVAALPEKYLTTFRAATAK